MRLKIGQYIEADVTSQTSHYKKVRGRVKKVNKNGWVDIETVEVIDKWSKTNRFEDHPSSCAMGVKLENIKLLTEEA